MDWSALETKLGYTFQDKDLILRALTHSTYRYESPDNSEGDNERLEFLGDGILDFIVGDLLYRRSEEYSEGAMSKMRSLIVCETTLAIIAKELDLGSHMRFGKGEKQSGGTSRSSNLSSALEAVIAAIYLDGGYEAAYRTVARLMDQPIRRAVRGELVYDHKSKLLEYIQGIDKQAVMEFCIVREEGPDHDRTFFCEFRYNGITAGEGSGPSKKEAEQNAAREGLRNIRQYCRPPEPPKPGASSSAAGPLR